MASEDSPRPILVAGDVTIDWNVAHLPGDGTERSGWNPRDDARICCEPGGAALLACLISALCRRRREDGLTGEFPVIGPDGSEVPPDCAEFGNCHFPDAMGTEGCACPDFTRCHHSYALWEPHAQSGDSGPPWVWRVAEHLGLDHTEIPRERPDGIDARKPSLVVLDDADLGFRDDDSQWPGLLRGETPEVPDTLEWVVAKLAEPVARGPLWERLRKHFAKKTVAVTTITDLRRQAVTISEGISWERTAQDLYWELTHNPAVSALSTCAHTVVSLGPAGALLLSWSGTDSGGKPEWDCRLIFDPEVVEGEWQSDYPGGMVGYTTCLTAGLVAQLLSGEPDMAAGVRAGVSALRQLHRIGYGEQPMDEPQRDVLFPLEAVAREALWPTEKLPITSVEDPVQHVSVDHAQAVAGPDGPWTILDDLCPSDEAPCDELGSNLARTAAEAVRVGIGRALKGAPICEIGALVTVDRREAEGYRRVRRLIRQYARGDQSKPLAIAVFGPPGSGKSFGVTQVAESVAEANVEECEFNISQFDGPEDMVAALHRVRDIGLSGKTPLVFWDEFDTDHLKWLKRILAPKQDGTFRNRQMLHHVGRAIFVFAGGTAETMEDFDRSRIENEAVRTEFAEAKGPDFVSRIKGYLNVMGPNQQGEEDRHYLLRRAVLLRSLLQRNAGQLMGQEGAEAVMSIDRGVLRAFLHISEYKHGVRSMEAIISMSSLVESDHFMRSCLPDVSQLDLHVDGGEFLALTQLPELEGELLERLAAATHEVYQGSVGDYSGKPEHAEQGYEDLPEHLKESNRAFIRSIFAKLRSIGYTLMPARSGDPPVDFPGEHLEALAEAEHERWMWERLQQGYCYAPEHGDGSRRPMTNPHLIPWSPMSEEEREAQYGKYAECVGPGWMTDEQRQWDRDMVAAIPKLLAEAGYTVVRLEDMEAEPIPPRRIPVAVTGHRFLAEVEKLQVAVQEALDRLEAAFPDGEPVIVSPLAEGADRLVAEIALERRMRLFAPLPFAQEEYLEDFESEESKEQFVDLLEQAAEVIDLPPTEERNDAYAQVGEWVLNHSDAIIALWDGQPSQGTGGTADVVERALERGMPVLHIKAGNRRPGTNEPTSLGDEQGELVVHNL